MHSQNSSIDQKEVVRHVSGDVTPDSVESADHPSFDPKRTKKLLRKLDWNIVPFLALLYL
jgi:hypothetical protein